MTSRSIIDRMLGSLRLQSAVYIEQFDTLDHVVQFQHDWGEDHCHSGDRAFTNPADIGGVGFRVAP